MQILCVHVYAKVCVGMHVYMHIVGTFRDSGSPFHTCMRGALQEWAGT